MKMAVLFYVPIAGSPGALCWRWRSTDGKADSSHAFHYYRDCVDDARENGYRIEVARQPHGGPLADTLDRDSLDERFFSGQAAPTLH
jgi:hypothetical protein